MAKCPPNRGALASSDVDNANVQQAAEEIVRAGSGGSLVGVFASEVWGGLRNCSSIFVRSSLIFNEIIKYPLIGIPPLLKSIVHGFLAGISVEVLLKAAGIILEPWL